MTIYKFNSVDKSANVFKYNRNGKLGEIQTAKFQARNMSDYHIGHSVTVQDGVGTYIFRGWITNVSIRGDIYIITAFDKTDDLKDKIYSNVWEGDTLEAIFKALVEYAGLTYWRTPTSETPVITKYVMKDNDVFNELQKIADTLDWIFYYNPVDDKVYFTAPSYDDNGTILTIGTDTFITQRWSNDDVKMVNEITFLGGRQKSRTVQSFDGTGAQVTFTLTSPPDALKITVGGTLQTMGVSGVTSTYDYTVDKENKQVTFEAGSTPGAGTGNVVIEYEYSFPIRIESNDPTSLATYGKYGKRITDKEVKTMTDARKYVGDILTKGTEPMKRNVIRTAKTISLGEYITVIDAKNGINGKFLVTNINYYEGKATQEYTVSNQEVKMMKTDFQVQQRLKKLEDETDATDIVQKYYSFPETQSVNQTVEIKIYKRFPYNSFILGHSINGLLGMGAFLDDFEASSPTWSSTEATISRSNIQYKIGSYAIKAICADGTNFITQTQSYGNISTYTGIASGTPTKGTVGIWAHISNYELISSITLKIGSGDSDYVSMIAGEYQTRHAAGYSTTHTTGGFITGWNYLLFDLDTASIIGTPDWTAVDFAQLIIVNTSTPTIYFDYLTISSPNYIGLNGLGNRVGDKILIQTI